jgi:DNA polymerase-3 subunit alpha (Gram-positive type)
VLRVQGKLVVDKFDNETVLQPYSMMTASMPKRKDLHEGEKRVELHLHTTMSNMDALTDTAAAVKQAAAWGHRAIAITDHGCAHSFPDAMKAASKAKVAGTDQNIKVLYGCEGYFVNDVDDRQIVRGDKNIDFDGFLL